MGEYHRRGVESPRVHCTLFWSPFLLQRPLPAHPLCGENGALRAGLCPAWHRSWAGRVRRQLNPGRKYGTCGPSVRPGKHPSRAGTARALPPRRPQGLAPCEGLTTTAITGCPKCLAQGGLPVEGHFHERPCPWLPFTDEETDAPGVKYLARGHTVRNS